MTGQQKRLEELCRQIAQRIKASLPPSVGFTLFLMTYGPGGWLTYLSSVQRADMIKTIEEWLGKEREANGEVPPATPSGPASANPADGPKVIISTSEPDRVAQLENAFRDQLERWMIGLMAGVRLTEGVADALALTLAEAAAVVVLGQPQVADEVIESDAMALAKEFVTKLRAEAGAPS